NTNVFFFQAEDGIRDFHVTGVQTCALPISQPLGPTIAHMLLGNGTVVGSTKDLNPASLIDFKRISPSGYKGSLIRFLNPSGSSRSEERRVGKEGRARCGTERAREKYERAES